VNLQSKHANISSSDFSFLKKEADTRRSNMSNMGELFESITDEYLMPKKRRLAARSHIVSAAKRHGGSFRQIPDLDTTDQD
jgi:vacuolar protein sorting-associated protein 72